MARAQGFYWAQEEGSRKIVNILFKMRDTRLIISKSMSNHSLDWEHLLIVESITNSLTDDTHSFYVFDEISRILQNCTIWIRDRSVLFFLVNISATAIAQATQHISLAYNRSLTLQDWFFLITDESTMFDMLENEWKSWRAIFNLECIAHTSQLVHLNWERIDWKKSESCSSTIVFSIFTKSVSHFSSSL